MTINIISLNITWPRHDIAATLLIWRWPAIARYSYTMKCVPVLDLFNHYGRIQTNVFLLFLTLTWLVGHRSRLTCMSHFYTFLCNYMFKFKLGIHVFGQSPVTAISDSRPLHVRGLLLIKKNISLNENMSAIIWSGVVNIATSRSYRLNCVIRRDWGYQRGNQNP